VKRDSLSESKLLPAGHGSSQRACWSRIRLCDATPALMFMQPLEEAGARVPRLRAGARGLAAVHESSGQVVIGGSTDVSVAVDARGTRRRQLGSLGRERRTRRGQPAFTRVDCRRGRPGDTRRGLQLGDRDSRMGRSRCRRRGARRFHWMALDGGDYAAGVRFPATTKWPTTTF